MSFVETACSGMGLELHDIAESHKDSSTIGGLEVSDCGEGVVPKGGERLVLALGHGKAVRVDADIAAPVELVRKVNHGAYICAESGRVNATT